MLYGFSLNLFESDGEKIWIAESTDLKGCIGQGETQEVAIKELESNEMAWIEAAKEFDIPIPEKSVKLLDSDFSGKLRYMRAESIQKLKVSSS